jgi:DHA2 family methylenomycin A resistance protein-like MFS transporter
VNFLGLFGLYAAIYLITVHLQTGLGFSPLETGIQFVALFGALGVAAVLASRVVRQWGTRATMVAGLGCIAVGMAGLTLLAGGVGYAGYAWALVLLGVGVPLSSGVVAIQAMMGAVPSELAATASGAMNTFRQFGAVFGVALAGILSPVRDGVVTMMHVTFLTAGGAALAAAVLTAVVLRPVPDAASTR